jgi:putative transposase
MLHCEKHCVPAPGYRYGTVQNTRAQPPQSNGMAEALVKTFKRDYVPINPAPDTETVMARLPSWFEHYNNLNPHKALGYQSPREFLSRKAQP